MKKFRRLSFMNFSRYRVGRDGSVWSLAGRLKFLEFGKWKPLSLTIVKTPCGKEYYRIKMTDDNGTQRWFLVHHLVLFAFVGPKPDGHYEGCHNDNDGLNNFWKNLRWDTPKGNQADRVRHGTSNKGKCINAGEDSAHAKLNWEDVRRIRSEYAPNKNGYKKLAKKYGVSWGCIRSIIKYYNWKE